MNVVIYAINRKKNNIDVPIDILEFKNEIVNDLIKDILKQGRLITRTSTRFHLDMNRYDYNNVSNFDSFLNYKTFYFDTVIDVERGSNPKLRIELYGDKIEQMMKKEKYSLRKRIIDAVLTIYREQVLCYKHV